MTVEEFKASNPGVDTYTLNVKGKSKEYSIVLREIDRATFKAVSSLIQKDELMGVESLLKSLYVCGDSPQDIANDFVALRSASISILPLLQVEAGELKKN